MLKRLLLFILLLSSSGVAGYEKELTPFSVTRGAATLGLPFWGGINTPKPTLVDFDRDGLTDLLFGDPSGKLTYFRNIGSVSQPEWELVTERLGQVDIGTWHILGDIDGDLDLDLFCDSREGKVAFWRNISSEERITFELADSAFSGILTGQFNTPALADIDSDGDLDFFFGAPSGLLELYRNVGTATTPQFQFETDAYDSVLAFPRGTLASGVNHGFSALRFVDMDADHDLDLFYGDFFNPNLYYFVNLGDSILSDLTFQTENYLPQATQGFNHPSFADLDNDNDLDLVLGVAGSADLNCLRYYENMGDGTVAAWDLIDSSIIRSIDVGSAAVPTLGDLDDDGDLDLLIGGVSGRLTYYQNTGSADAPEFLFVTDSFANISVLLYSAPALVDWDSDNDLDLLVGTNAGRVEYWRNDGTANSYAFVKADAQLGGIKVDQLAIPVPVDMNGDSLLDLVIGEWDFNNRANVLLYRNNGTSGNPALTLQTASLLTRDTSRAFVVPSVLDWDGDGRSDLLIGTDKLGVTLYRNTADSGQFPDSLSMLLEDAEIPGNDDGFRALIREADIDNDGDRDLFVGELDGGLNFYRSDGDCCVGRRGNLNSSPDGLTDLSDLSMLIQHITQPFGPVTFPCPSEADLFEIGGGTIDMGDLIYLIAFLTGQLSQLPACK
ncbi:MAG: VCBS repeat-containing protein [bacterium]|nr:VCBS repeat-containing protein [bacterium]